MAQNRYYSNLSSEMELTSSVSDSATSLGLSSVTGLPAATPFTLVVDVGTESEEIVTVSAIVGSSVTVIRGQDNTPATAHGAGAKVRHYATARDYNEPQAHIGSSSGVHGVTSQVVGTTDAQALTNKTLNGSLNTFSNLPKGALPATVVYTTDVQTLTGKTLSGSSNTFTNVPKSAIPADTVYLATAQTLTGKVLDGGSNTFTNIPKSALPADTVYLADTSPATFLSTAANWTNAGSSLHLLNGVAYITLVYTRANSAISVGPTTGSVADVLVTTMNAGYWPETAKPAACFYGGTNGGWCRITTAGDVYFIHGSPGVDLAIGDTLTVSFAYPV